MPKLQASPSWEYGTDYVARWVKPDDQWEKQELLSWAPTVQETVIRYDDEGLDVLARQYLITVDDHTQLISHRDLTSGDAWQYFPRAGGLHKPIYPILSAIVTEQAVKASQVIGRPQSLPDGLHLPPDRYLPAGYGHHRGTADGLATLVDALTPHQYPSLLLGLSAISHLVKPAGLQPAWWTLLGDTTTGKTTALRAISALWGTPQHVVRGFSGTPNGLAGHLRDLAVLPAFWDELGANDMKPSQTLSFVMSTCEGAQRSARNRDDTARRTGSWYSYAFATGNRPLTDAHSPGLGARLIELNFTRSNPAIPADQKMAVQRATNQPEVAGCWIEHAPKFTAARFAADLETIMMQDGLRPPDEQVGMHMVRHLGAALVGCAYLEEVSGRVGIFDSAFWAARRILEGTADRVADLGGGNPAEELMLALTDDMERRPEQWNRQQADRRTDLLGYVEDDHLFVRPTVLPSIAAAWGIESWRICLQELKDDGRLVTTQGKGLRRNVREGNLMRAYYCISLSDSGYSGYNGYMQVSGLQEGDTETATAATAATAATTATVLPVVPDRPENARSQAVEPESDQPVAARIPRSRYSEEEQLDAFRQIIDDDTVSNDDVVAGLEWWRRTVRVGDRPVEISPRGAGMTGAAVYRMIQAANRAVPALTERCETQISRPPTTANWLHPDAQERAHARGLVVTAVDVNAQFLAASASTSYPLGDPVRIDAPQVTPALLKQAGYLKIGEASPIPLPYPQDTMIPMPVARYLHEIGRLPEITQAVVWASQRRVLAPWAKVFREARAALLAAPPEPGVGAALAAVKAVSNRFLSGWMVSARANRTELLRPEWADAHIGTARANAVRALAKLHDPTAVLGVFTDTAFVAGDVPAGLIYSDQPGKWKHVATITATEQDLRSPATLFRAVHDAR